jgi:hypothetical protein
VPGRMCLIGTFRASRPPGCRSTAAPLTCWCECEEVAPCNHRGTAFLEKCDVITFDQWP